MTSRYLLRLLLATAALAPCWWLATPLYNRYLVEASENLLHLLEVPNVSRLLLSSSPHEAILLRLDFPPSRQTVSGLRLTDLHFTAALAAAVVLAQRTPLRKRLSQLLEVVLFCTAFHLALVLSLTYCVYAVELGDWSMAHYGPVSCNGLALVRHLLHLPFKLALPLLAYVYCCYPASNLDPSSS